MSTPGLYLKITACTLACVLIANGRVDLGVMLYMALDLLCVCFCSEGGQ